MVAKPTTVHLIAGSDAQLTLCGEELGPAIRWRISSAVPVGEMNRICDHCFQQLMASAQQRRRSVDRGRRGQTGR